MNASGTTHDRYVPGDKIETELAAIETIKAMIPDSINDGRKKKKNICKGHRWYKSKNPIRVDDGRYVESFTIRDASMVDDPKLIHHAYYYCKLCNAHELLGRIVGTINQRGLV